MPGNVEKFFLGFQTPTIKHDVWKYLISSQHVVLVLEGQHPYSIRSDECEVSLSGEVNKNAFLKMFVLYNIEEKIISIEADNVKLNIANHTSDEISSLKDINAVCFFTYINRSNVEYSADYDEINRTTTFIFEWK